MRRDFAESFSLSFHPILIGFYSLLFVFVLPVFEVQALGIHLLSYIGILVFVTTVAFPVFSLLMLRKQKIISSLSMPQRQERGIAYLLNFTYYGITAYMLFRMNFIPLLIPLLIAISAMGNLVLFFFNLWIKVSAHALAMGSLTMLIIALTHFYDLRLIVPLTVVALLSLIVILSRHYLKMHTYSELILGYVLGILVCYGVFWVGFGF